ncbi:hypothetical protein ASPFODRAFT_356717 [Aspergillus luchuensis CBS 106.47]|uniref:Uncharacterized protein n=1 Tax=Aspergillus luchuensis (strain CBS 106.47) TaxID=1137211 RepID=A0A1M3T6P3_ASPLC|nr:hypothetical protein ASPFODRAFT_356717 [Aspergillus luchuensis CBS 106.47]
MKGSSPVSHSTEMGDGNNKEVLGGTREGPVFGGTKGRRETRSQRGLVRAWRYQVGGRTLLSRHSVIQFQLPLEFHRKMPTGPRGNLLSKYLTAPNSLLTTIYESGPCFFQWDGCRTTQWSASVIHFYSFSLFSNPSKFPIFQYFFFKFPLLVFAPHCRGLVHSQQAKSIPS